MTEFGEMSDKRILYGTHVLVKELKLTEDRQSKEGRNDSSFIWSELKAIGAEQAHIKDLQSETNSIFGNRLTKIETEKKFMERSFAPVIGGIVGSTAGAFSGQIK